MDKETVYDLDWQFDYWSNIESIYPIGCKVNCVVTRVERNYAFLDTIHNVCCFLDKRKVSGLWVVSDLTEEIKIGDYRECKVIDYNREKESLIVSLNLNQ